jgi:hypothetical protein
LATNTAHGLRWHPLYGTWRQMIARCENPAHEGYPNYGAPGITVCEPWHDVARFITDIESEIGPRPVNPPGWTSRKTYWSLDRTDNDRGYEAGNVQWATQPEQVHKRRSATMTQEKADAMRHLYATSAYLVSEIAEKFGISPSYASEVIRGVCWTVTG